MRHARVLLSLALALALLESSMGLAARPQAAEHSTVQTMGPHQAATGLTSYAWQRIQAQVAKLTAADGSTGFGSSVSLDGDTAVVGASSADVGGNSVQGAAYVFYRDQGGPDAWSQVVRLTATDGATGDAFGGSVSVVGDMAVIGAIGADVGGSGNQGAAYVFYRNQGGLDAWGQVAKLTAADGVTGDGFGWSVSVDGDTAVVGAYSVAVGGTYDQGAAYVFYRNQGGPDAWGQVARLTAADGGEMDHFGCSVSVADDTAVVGATADIGDNQFQGAVYVFYRNQGGADAWGQVAKLFAADGAEMDWFGWSVSVSGDTAVVGSSGTDVGGNSDRGAVYVYYRDQGGADAWGQVARLTAADGTTGDRFGNRVSVCDDAAVVGASEAKVGGNQFQGAAYIFYRDRGGADAWGQVAKLTAEDGATGDAFGNSVSVGSDMAIVGAILADVGSTENQGAAYVYALPPTASDDAFTTDEDMALEVAAAPGLLANDIDPQGDPLTAVLDAAPSYGTLDLHLDGSFIYTPTANYYGLDTFTYHANDGQDDSGVATVAITITAVNDAPVAANDAYSAAMDWPLTVAGPGVLLNDTDVDNDPVSAVLDSGPSHGTLDLNSGGSFAYSPAKGFTGADTFTYHANDGVVGSNVATVEITVFPPVYLPLVSRGG